MPILFDIDFTDDPLYLEGFKVGIKRKSTFFIEKMLLEGGFYINEIIKISDQIKVFVLSIQNRLIEEGKLPRTA